MKNGSRKSIKTIMEKSDCLRNSAQKTKTITDHVKKDGNFDGRRP